MALVMQSGARLPSSLERCIPGVHIRENRLRKYARFMHQYRALAHAPSSPPSLSILLSILSFPYLFSLLACKWNMWMWTEGKRER